MSLFKNELQNILPRRKSVFQHVLKRAIVVLLAVSALGLHFYFADQKIKNNSFSTFFNKEILFEGQIEGDPENGLSFTRMSVRVNGFWILGNFYPVEKSRILVAARPTQAVQYGDLVEIEGVLLKPQRKYPVFNGYMENPRMRFMGGNKGNALLKFLFKIKRDLTGRFNRIFPEPAASFFPGLLLGVRSTIPKSLTDDFKRTGLSHIIALSGYNIAILIAFTATFFSFLPRRTALALNVAAIAVFTLLVGLGASVVRAAIMGSMGLVAKAVGRKSAGLRALFVSGFVMIAFDPFIAVYDVGFQLSFAATAGILMFAQHWQNRLAFMPNFFGARDSLVTTFAAQVFTLPIIIYYFKGISIIAPLANILVLPFVPILMLGGFLSLIFGKLAAAPVWLLFEIIAKIIHLLASLSFSFWELPTDWGI